MPTPLLSDMTRKSVFGPTCCSWFGACPTSAAPARQAPTAPLAAPRRRGSTWARTYEWRENAISPPPLEAASAALPWSGTQRERLTRVCVIRSSKDGHNTLSTLGGAGPVYLGFTEGWGAAAADRCLSPRPTAGECRPLLPRSCAVNKRFAVLFQKPLTNYTSCARTARLGALNNRGPLERGRHRRATRRRRPCHYELPSAAGLYRLERSKYKHTMTSTLGVVVFV